MDVGRVAPVKYPLIQTRGRAVGNCSNLGNLRNNGQQDRIGMTRS